MSEADMMNGHRRQLEQRAEEVRSRLERRLDALDERRGRVVELAKRAASPPISIALIGTAAVVGAAVVIHQVRQRPGRRQRRFAPARKPDGFLAKVLKRAALSLVATLVQRVSQRGLDRFLPEEPIPQPLPEAPQQRVGDAE